MFKYYYTCQTNKGHIIESEVYVIDHIIFLKLLSMWNRSNPQMYHYYITQEQMIKNAYSQRINFEPMDHFLKSSGKLGYITEYDTVWLKLLEREMT